MRKCEPSRYFRFPRIDLPPPPYDTPCYVTPHMLQVVDADFSAIIIETGLNFSLVSILLSFLKEKNRASENGLLSRSGSAYLV